MADMTGFTVGPLQPGDARAVFPLIREASPAVALPRWLSYVRTVTSGRLAGQAGVVVARRVGRAYPCGLFCYRVENELERGRVLTADHFVAVDLLDPAAVLDALVRELEALGVRQGCSAVRGVVHGTQTELAGGLSAAGHALEASLFVRRLEPDSRL